jgi:hypothetical protein
MKIEKIISIGNLPTGEIMVALLEDKTFQNKNWKAVLQMIPMGVSKIGQKFFFTILADDAITFSIPHLNIQSTINQNQYA